MTSSSSLLALRCGGMVTAIGNSAGQTAASWLTQVRRLRRVTLEGFADPFTIADCATVTAGLHGVERLAALLGSAVAEAYDGWAALPPAEPGECLEILVLPDWLPTDDGQRLSDMLTGWLTPYDAWTTARRERLIVNAGTTGAWVALDHAYRALAQRPHLRHVMIAAVDSACEPAQLAHAAQQGWLLQPGNAQGYVAGEAAACLHLTRVHNIGEVPANGFALHRPARVPAGARYWPSEDRPDAGPLAQALTAALQSAGMQPKHISHLASDMDGSDWRAHLESTALTRAFFHDASPVPHWRFAALLGQPGAASGLIGWLLPTVLHAHRIVHLNSLLHWSFDPAGDTAACVLERSPH